MSHGKRSDAAYLAKIRASIPQKRLRLMDLLLGLAVEAKIVGDQATCDEAMAAVEALDGYSALAGLSDEALVAWVDEKFDENGKMRLVRALVSLAGF